MLSARHSARRSHGLTAIELMVVLVTFGVMAAVAMPQFSSWMTNLRVRNVAESVRHGMELARMEALKRNSSVSFWMVSDGDAKVPGNSCALATDSASWVVSVVDPSGSCAAAASLTEGPQLVQRSQAANTTGGVTVAAVDSANVPSSRVTFSGLGRPNAGSIQQVDVVAQGARDLRVTVNAGGAIRMCDVNAGAGDPRRC